MTLEERRKPWYKDRGNIIIIVLIAIGSVMIIGSQLYSSTTKELIVNQQLLLEATDAIKSGFNNLTSHVQVANEKQDETNVLIGNLTDKVVIGNSLMHNLTIALKDPHRFDPITIRLNEVLNNITLQHREMMRAIENLTR